MPRWISGRVSSLKMVFSQLVKSSKRSLMCGFAQGAGRARRLARLFPFDERLHVNNAAGQERSHCQASAAGNEGEFQPAFPTWRLRVSVFIGEAQGVFPRVEDLANIVGQVEEPIICGNIPQRYRIVTRAGRPCHVGYVRSFPEAFSPR